MAGRLTLRSPRLGCARKRALCQFWTSLFGVLRSGLSRNLRRVCERRGLCLFAGDQPEGPPMGHGHSAYGASGNSWPRTAAPSLRAGKRTDRR
jgi:hypothetical protein